MFVKKQATVLFSLLLFAQITKGAEIIADDVTQDRVNYMSKIKVVALLKKQPDIVYVETRNLDNDLQIAEIAKYFNCQTLAGGHFLESALRLPISPKSSCDTVAKRQSLNMALCNYPEFKAEVAALATELAKVEQVVCELMSKKYRNLVCPEEDALKELQVKQSGLYRFFRPINANQDVRTMATALTIGLISHDVAIAAGYVYSPTHKALKFFGASDAILHKFDVITRINSTGAVLLDTYFQVRRYRKTMQTRQKVHALSKIVAIAEKFESLCTQYGVAPQFKISAITDEASLELIRELKKSRYTQADVTFFLAPRVDAFLYSLYEKEGCLANLFACVAEMDACNAIATKMLASQNQSNQFCFAQFVHQARAEINATGFWNLLINTPTVITNDLYGAKNVIFSGVNGGGKTSSTRAILQNIVLAQTFGIAAAQAFVFTPFDVMHAYLNVSDNLLAGESLFVSEVKRAQEVKEKIRSLAGTDLKYFFALDELFTGTSDKAGQDCACAFLENIVQSSNIMFIYPTHFDKLKEFGEVNEYCINYKVDTAVKLADGRLVYPFTISRGASYDNVALDIATSANLFN